VFTVGAAILAGLWSLALLAGHLVAKARGIRLPRRLAGAAALLTLLRAVPAGGTVPPPAVRLAQQPAEPVEPEDPDDDEGPSQPVVVPEPKPGASYQVRPGDSLWAIAHNALHLQHGRHPSDREVDRYWHTIYAANRTVVGADPDLIYPGQIFALPEVIDVG